MSTEQAEAFVPIESLRDNFLTIAGHACVIAATRQGDWNVGRANMDVSPELSITGIRFSDSADPTSVIAAKFHVVETGYDDQSKLYVALKDGNGRPTTETWTDPFSRRVYDEVRARFYAVNPLADCFHQASIYSRRVARSRRLAAAVPSQASFRVRHTIGDETAYYDIKVPKT